MIVPVLVMTNPYWSFDLSWLSQTVRYTDFVHLHCSLVWSGLKPDSIMWSSPFFLHINSFTIFDQIDSQNLIRLLLNNWALETKVNLQKMMMIYLVWHELRSMAVWRFDIRLWVKHANLGAFWLLTKSKICFCISGTNQASGYKCVSLHWTYQPSHISFVVPQVLHIFTLKLKNKRHESGQQKRQQYDATSTWPQSTNAKRCYLWTTQTEWTVKCGLVRLCQFRWTSFILQAHWTVCRSLSQPSTDKNTEHMN